MKDIIDTVKELPITKKLYELKQNGKCPYVVVRLKDGKPTAVYLHISDVTYYFHETQTKNEANDLPITQDENGDWKIYFDGWGVSI